ncbi:MAG: hypothetical protein JXB48_01585 [Candidatus Latescibacteria bacterium]|nr:hypothetical protein [Candidatus Latescibacterota bacterium]
MIKGIYRDFTPDFERIRKTVRHEEPDRVPLCEVLIDYQIQSLFLGRKITADDIESQIEFWVHAGYDFVPITVGMMTPGKVTDESLIARVIREKLLNDSDTLDERSWNPEYRSFIETRQDFERFPWDILENLDFSKFHKVQKILPDGMKVIAVTGKIFTLTWMLMGFNHFCTSLILDEPLVADIFQRVAEIQFQGLEKIFSMSFVGAVWVVDDIAFSNGPIIAPQAFRDHVFPWYRKMAELCHKRNLLFFMHTDGNILPLIEDIIGLGVDVLHPIDPTCLDIIKVKEEFGDRLCLAGNVPNELLRNGTSDEVTHYVKKLIRYCAPGGGYCVGSGNSVPEWTKYENYMTMRETTISFGKYPILI